jgi:hypothetical protein
MTIDEFFDKTKDIANDLNAILNELNTAREEEYNFKRDRGIEELNRLAGFFTCFLTYIVIDPIEAKEDGDEPKIGFTAIEKD